MEKESRFTTYLLLLLDALRSNIATLQWGALHLIKRKDSTLADKATSLSP